MSDQRNTSVQYSLERLLLSNQIRDLAGYPRPVMVTDLSRANGLLVSIVRLAYGSDGLSRPRTSVWRQILVDSVVIVLLRLLLYLIRVNKAGRLKAVKISLSDGYGVSTEGSGVTGSRRLGSNLIRVIRRARKRITSTARIIYRNIRFHKKSSAEITGYVLSTHKEEPLIRICLLLRAMGRYGVCIELLIKRFNSGLPAAQARHWLSFFLNEIGDMNAASMISSCIGQQEAPDAAPSLSTSEQLCSMNSKWPQLKYGIVLPTMFDSDIFRSSLLSLLNSDFRGEIVVVEEGNQPRRACEAFCQQLPIKYVKNPRWDGLSMTINLGIKQLAPETDIIIYAHNDVLWPPYWFGQLNNAWERVYESNKVGVINLGYMQFNSGEDAALHDLFVRGRYSDLVWVLKAMRDVQPLMRRVQDVQIKDMSRTFGLARDSWNDCLAELHIMTGRFSVAASFLKHIWLGLGGFDENMVAGDVELNWYCFLNRKFQFWINNTPLIHCCSADTGALTNDDRMKFLQKTFKESYEAFPKKYGWEIEHLLFTYFAETSVIYHDEIVEAANQLRFSEIDFVFDDLFDRLKQKRLSSCELVWCNSRATCKYQ